MGYNLKFLFILILSLCLFFPRSINAIQDLPFYNPDILISLDFQDASLKDILKIFSIQSGLNFIASEAIKDRKITLYFDKVPLQDAMNKLFEANNLMYELDPQTNIFVVKDMGKPDVEVETRVFYLKYASVSTSSLMSEASQNIGSTAAATIAGTSVSTGTTSTGTTGVEATAGIVIAVQKLLSKNGVVIEDPRTNSLIVQDIPSRMPIIAQTITALDVPANQVLIEVEVLDVKKSIADKLGVHYGQTPITMTLTGPQTTGFGLSNFPIPGNLLRPLSGSSKSMTPGTMNFNTPYQVYLDFLKTQTDTKFLARPTILTLDNQTAEVKITTNEVTSVTSAVVQGAATTTSYQINQAETGVTLRVTPQINPDTNEITLFVMPTVKDTSNSAFSVAGQTAKDTDERTTKSIVRVKDGETIVIGGLIRRLHKETITKLPVFSDIPVLGALFRHKSLDPDSDRELIVFITPHIVKDKKTDMVKAKPVSLPNPPAREQEAFSVIDRKAVVSSALSSFGKR